MRSVAVAELKNQLSKYLGYVKAGEEVVIRDRNLPVAMLVPLPVDRLDHQELALVAQGLMRLPKAELNLKEFFKIRTGKVPGRQATEGLCEEREEGW